MFLRIFGLVNSAGVELDNCKMQESAAHRESFMEARFGQKYYGRHNTFHYRYCM